MVRFLKISQKNMKPENSKDKLSHPDRNFKHMDILSEYP